MTIVNLARPWYTISKQTHETLMKQCKRKQNTSRRQLLNDYRFGFDVSFGGGMNQ